MFNITNNSLWAFNQFYSYFASHIPSVSTVAKGALVLTIAAIGINMLKPFTHTARFDRPFLSDEDLACQMLDIKADPGFQDYREPNEGSPIHVRPHIQKMEKGWIVSTGTERSFFDLLLSNPDKCEGLIIRDIHPKVKAYCDFLILLLRLSNSREEFVALTRKTLQELQDILTPRIEKSGMSNKLKLYYLNYFTDLGSCYLRCKHSAQGDTSGINYFEDDLLFDKLQRYARAGKIIATVGDISDLRFAGNRKITLVDISNISTYSSLCLVWNGNHSLRVISTIQDPINTSYYSGVHNKIDEGLKAKMDSLIKSNSLTPLKIKNVAVLDRAIKGTSRNIFNTLPDNLYTKQNYDFIKSNIKNKNLSQYYK